MRRLPPKSHCFDSSFTPIPITSGPRHQYMSSENGAWPRWSRLFPNESVPCMTRDQRGYVHVEITTRRGGQRAADVEMMTSSVPSSSQPSSFVELFDEEERKSRNKSVKWDDTLVVSCISLTVGHFLLDFH